MVFSKLEIGFMSDSNLSNISNFKVENTNNKLEKFLSNNNNNKKELIEAELEVDIFPDLEVIFIGKHSFDKEQLIRKFHPQNRSESGLNPSRVISLLKRVFQNKYSETRINGLPKVPHRKKDKENLIKMLTHYFNNLRTDIILKKEKSGNTVSLRENIEHLQYINILIDHFEDDNESFPYELFQEYIDNQEYFQYSHDLVDQLKKIKSKEHQDTRIRNLLRQFARLFLLNAGDDQFILKDPGITEEQLEKSLEEIKDRIPPVLQELLDLLKGKMKMEGVEDYSFINNLIGRLKTEFNTIKNEDINAIPSTEFATNIPSGGAKKQDTETVISDFVNEIFDAYKNLKEKHDKILPEHNAKLGAKQSKYYDNIKLLTEKHESTINELTSQLNSKDNIIKIKDEEISKIQTLINKLQNTLVEKKKIENDIHQQLEELTSEKNNNSAKGKIKLERGIKTLVNDKVKLLKEKTILENNLIEAKSKLIEENAAKLTAEEEIVSLRYNLEKSKKRYELEKKDVKRLEEELDNTVDIDEHQRLIDEKDSDSALDASVINTLYSQLSELENIHNKDVEYIDKLKEDIKNLALKQVKDSTNGWPNMSDVNRQINENSKKQVKDSTNGWPNMSDVNRQIDENSKKQVKDSTNGWPNMSDVNRQIDENSEKYKHKHKDSPDPVDIWHEGNVKGPAYEENNETHKHRPIDTDIPDPVDIWHEGNVKGPAYNENNKQKGGSTLSSRVVGSSKLGHSNNLYKYCVKISENRLDDFLLENPLPFFSIIKDFEKSSNMKVIKETNEFYILQEFIQLQLEEHFDNLEMKNFYYEFKNLFMKEKKFLEELEEFCFVMYEICNTINNSEKNIDVVKCLDTKYSSFMDELESKININYDFYDQASKNLGVKNISLKFYENHIYFYKNTNSFEKVYSMNNSLELSLITEDFNEEIYYVNDGMLYYFFILSTYFLIKKDIKENEFLNSLDKHSRTMKRKHKSAKKLLQDTLDG